MQLKKTLCGCGENDKNVTITNKNHSSLVLRDELVIFWRSKVMDPRHVFGHNLKNTGVEIIITKKMDKRVAPEVNPNGLQCQNTQLYSKKSTLHTTKNGYKAVWPLVEPVAVCQLSPQLS